MKQRGWGRIVNMASSTFFTGASGFSHYVASKGGMIGFTRALATELGPHGITVNAIAPALTRTPGAHGARAASGRDRHGEVIRRAAARQAIPRVQVPADLVGTVSFLTSDDAAFITGQTLHVNGGLVRDANGAASAAVRASRRSTRQNKCTACGAKNPIAMNAKPEHAEPGGEIAQHHHAGDDRRRRQHDADLERGRRHLVVVILRQRSVARASAAIARAIDSRQPSP